MNRRVSVLKKQGGMLRVVEDIVWIESVKIYFPCALVVKKTSSYV